jgi:tRNA(Ile)-lysidine synthase TilS/MesJ
VTLIRPLLAATKGDCEGFCRKAGVRWREDPSNVDPRRLRARLRRDVLPVLEALWPDVSRRISATADVVCAAKHALEQRIEEAFGPAHERQWDREILIDLPESILAAGLRRAALDASPAVADSLNQRHLLTAAALIRSDLQQPKRFAWPRGLTLEVTVRRVSLAQQVNAAR